VLSLNYQQYTDFRKVFTWLDTDGVSVIGLADGRMQAKDSNDAVVMDIGFFATPPDEAAIGALDPEKRGYLSPIEGASLELHISDQAVVPAGNYTYDILVQEAGGDWGILAEGTLIVEAGTTSPPV